MTSCFVVLSLRIPLMHPLHAPIDPSTFNPHIPIHTPLHMVPLMAVWTLNPTRVCNVVETWVVSPTVHLRWERGRSRCAIRVNARAWYWFMFETTTRSPSLTSRPSCTRAGNWRTIGNVHRVCPRRDWRRAALARSHHGCRRWRATRISA